MVLIESVQKTTRKGGDRVNKWLKALMRRTKGEKGVTLIELLAVIVIIAVIAAIAVPVVLGAINRSKENTVKQNMAVMAEALNRYAFDHNDQFPSTGGQWQDASSALLALMPPSSSSGGSSNTSNNTDSGQTAYLQSVPKDPWGQDFYYRSDGTYFQIETAKAYGLQGAQGEIIYMSNKMSQAVVSNTVPAQNGSW
jgi:general secretion pathway protein G